MARKLANMPIAIKADPTDPEDFDVSEEALAHAQAARCGRSGEMALDRPRLADAA
jgi:hypothetical protein